MLQSFLASEHTRKRYWARSLVGWSRVSGATPNDAHRSLAALENTGRIELLVTQNVDGLHQAAGSRNVLDLHGRVDVVRCMACASRLPRAHLQAELAKRNPTFVGSRRGRSARRRRRSRRCGLRVLRRAGLRRMRRPAEARRRVLRRERAEGARESRNGRRRTRGRDVGRRLVADGVLGLPLRESDGGARQADRCRQLGYYSRRPSALAEGRGTMRGRARVSDGESASAAIGREFTRSDRIRR